MLQTEGIMGPILLLSFSKFSCVYADTDRKNHTDARTSMKKTFFLANQAQTRDQNWASGCRARSGPEGRLAVDLCFLEPTNAV